MTEAEAADAGDDWQAFEQRLTKFLRALNEDESLVLAVADTDHSTKVLGLPGGYLHGELALHRKADPASALELGWQDLQQGLMGKARLGSRKLSADVARRDASRLSAMLVGALRDLWSATGPQSLRASAPGDGPPVEQLKVPVGKR